MRIKDSLDNSLADEDFYESLATDNELGAVVRGHLFVEHELNSFIASKVRDAKPLDKIRLDYEDKVNLAVALGLPTDMAPVYLAFGRIRNRFAHNLKAHLDENSINSIYGSLPSGEKELVHKAFKKISEDGAMQDVNNFNDVSFKMKFSLLSVQLRRRLIIFRNQNH